MKQIPVPFGGLDGAAVYVDTEGSFTAERAADIAEATAKHLAAISRANPEDQHMADAMASFTAERVLDRIHLFRCHEVTELLAVLETPLAVVTQEPKFEIVFSCTLAGMWAATQVWFAVTALRVHERRSSGAPRSNFLREREPTRRVLPVDEATGAACSRVPAP